VGELVDPLDGTLVGGTVVGGIVVGGIVVDGSVVDGTPVDGTVEGMALDGSDGVTVELGLVPRPGLLVPVVDGVGGLPVVDGAGVICATALGGVGRTRSPTGIPCRWIRSIRSLAGRPLDNASSAATPSMTR
jgi:hypothetical protein